MRFLVDNSVSWRLADALRTAAHDALHVRDVGLRDAPDPEIYRRACDDARVVVTQDVDFGFLLAQETPPKGIVILFRTRDGRVASQLSRMLDLINRFPHELIPGTITVLTDRAIRIRRF